MRASHLLTLLLTGLLITAAGSVAAGDDPFGNRPDPFALDAECRIGNLNPPVGPAYPDVFRGNESYAFHVTPLSQCSFCDEDHFKLESVSMLVEFTPNQVPQSLVVRPALLEAVFDTGINCFVPGEPFCVGPDLVFPVETPGVTMISAPFEECGPFPLESDYFISLSFEGGGPANLPVDDEPLPCTEFINAGNGWIDLYDRKSGGDKTGGGKVIVFGDIVCVISGVAVEKTSWGAIKTLYR